MAFLTFHILYNMLFRLSALVCKILYNKGLYLYVAMLKYVCCETTNYDESNNIRHMPNMTLTRKPTTKPICMRRLEGLGSCQSFCADHNLNLRKYNVRSWRVFASILPKDGSLFTPHKEEWKQREEKSD